MTGILYNNLAKGVVCHGLVGRIEKIVGILAERGLEGYADIPRNSSTTNWQSI